ncbi:hypothetical protein AMTRI_Chr11g96050 [Amborella trichopoda]
MVGKIVLVLLVGLMGITYKTITPPPPKICGSPSGPPVTGPRVRLKDDRLLAYFEKGDARAKATYKIVMAHGFHCSRYDSLLASQEFLEEHGVYILSYDRAGYGESDPNPKRSVKSEAFDVENLADALQLGPKFYVMGFSMGGHTVWSCLKYIPHREYLPYLILSCVCVNLQHQARQQGIYESLVRDANVGFGSWDYDPMELHNPFPNGEGSVHLWHGDDDLIVPVMLQRYIPTKLPWIKYHELPSVGHMLIYDPNICDTILKALLQGEKNSS